MFDLFSDPVKVAQQMEIIFSEYGFAIWETMYALVLEVIFAYIVGLPLGARLVTGEKDGIRPMPAWVMKTLNIVINLLRSVPFLILMIIALPLSKIIVGTILGYGAMAGIIGGGGLGKMAINYGYYNFKYLVMWSAVIGLILLVQIFQSVGTKLAQVSDKRLRNRN